MLALVTVGASLTAVMFNATVSTSVNVPPAPVLPRSLVVTVRVTAPFALAAVVYVTLLAAIKALMAVCVPVNTRLPDPEPATPTPTTAVAASMPVGTLSVTEMPLAPASTSATLKPVSAVTTSSVTVIEPGVVLTGASLTALTAMLTVSISVNAPPPTFPLSLVVMVRVAVPLKLAVGT